MTPADRSRQAHWKLASRTSVVGALLCTGVCAASPGADAPPAPGPQKVETAKRAQSAEERWGIQPVSLRLTAGGTMLDFRYQVLDAKKALPLFDRKLKPYLFDASSGQALGVPEEGKLGALRSSARNPPVGGKRYFIFFSNGFGTVKKGARVTVVIGDCRLENLLVD
jgi:hypothetical protein